MKSYLTRTMALAGTAMLFFSVASADDPIDQRLKAVEKKLQQQQQVIDSQRNEIRELRAELDKGKAQQTMTRDEVKAVIKEAMRKDVKYLFAPCKPTAGPRELPCETACTPRAIVHSW